MLEQALAQGWFPRLVVEDKPSKFSCAHDVVWHLKLVWHAMIASNVHVCMSAPRRQHSTQQSAITITIVSLNNDARVLLTISHTPSHIEGIHTHVYTVQCTCIVIDKCVIYYLWYSTLLSQINPAKNAFSFPKAGQIINGNKL